MNEGVNKFTWTEILIGVFFTLLVDGVCFLLDFTGVGDFITPFIQAIVTFVMTWWLWMKGDKNAVKTGRQITKYLVNIIPWLPTTLVAFIIEVYIHNNPKSAISQTVGKVAGATQSKPALTKAVV